jgi:hypothetical protein
MKWMVGVALLAGGLSGDARADEPDLGQLRAIGAKAVPAHDAWEQCTAAVVRAELGSKTPAEGVAEEALRRCIDREGRLISVLARGIGRQKARTVVGELRNLQRESLISVIEELRQKEGR